MDERRRALVAAAVARWSEQLIDVAGRNALLHYRDLKAGTLDLDASDPVARAAVAAGRTVPLARLFTDPATHADAVRRARTIRNKARELHEERGIETCYLALGNATWVNPKGGATPSAPVLLRSAVLRARGAAEDDFDLTVTADAEVNPVLVHVLATEFDVRFDAEQVADLEPAQAFERIAKEASERVRGFTIRPREVVSTFSYAKLPMVTDLAAAEQVLGEHDVVAAIAGDGPAQAAIRVPAEIDPAAPDTLPPSAEFIVLDADSSQHAAINAILAGQHAVIKGPPGTGKSQTIANLIASLVARGRRVLFVAEKRAAITAVTDRLGRRGLGQLVMDVHDGTSSRRRIAAELRTAYESAARIALPDLGALHETLADRRTRLAGYAQALHEVRQPWGVSFFTARAALLTLPVPPPVRLRGPALSALGSQATRQVRELLREYESLGGFAPASSPWHVSTVHSGVHAQAAWLAAGRLTALPRALEPVLAAIASVGLTRPQRVAELRAARSLVDGVADTLRRFDPAVYEAPLADLAAACADANWRRAQGIGLGPLKRWSLRRRARALARTPISRPELFRALLAAREQRERWGGGVHGAPRVPAQWDAVRAVHEAVEADVAVLAGCLPAVDFGALSWAELAAFAGQLAADDRTLRRQPRRLQVAAALADAGAGPAVDALRAAGGDPVTGFDAIWYSSIVEHVAFADPRIGGFDPATHDRIVADFRAADVAHLDAAAQRVLRAVAEYIVATRDRFPEQDRLVEHQASLKRRHLPMRQLFAAAPDVLTALKPCWAMSPLVVSQLLPAGGQYFDVVVFDEASQVTPADAVPAILRARQIVVAGDEHQLPPTAFFSSTVDSTDGAVGVTADGAIDLSLTSGYESILDVLTALLPAYMLRWHYRSRDDRLIGFSNQWIYDRSLVTFPGTAGTGRLTHVLVDGAGVDESGESSRTEVARVVDLVLAHAAERPNETLGVIAMGITHADRIDRALRTALARRPELHGFFAETAAEPFFVKNLERVQGDERDAIILSVGYGKTPDGRLLYRFGPLLTAGGERRLNVAITRARARMTVVSSFSATEMDPGRSTARGVQLLREYLSYAATGGSGYGSAVAGTAELTPFEREVAERLRAAGVPVVARYGLSGQHVEFAAAHPERPDDLLFAVETDGPAYRAADTVRDRDRLRPAQLGRLGWRVHRIWSTDWFVDPAAEVDRAVAAYRAAIPAPDEAEDAPEAAGASGAPNAGAMGSPVPPMPVPPMPVPPMPVPPTPVPPMPEPPMPEPSVPVPPLAVAPVAVPPAPVVPAPVPPPVSTTPPAPVAPPPVAASAATGSHPGAEPPVPMSRRRTERPPVQPGLPISGYRHADLVALVRWILSDTLLRTEDEVLEEVMKELGFTRKGPRIREAILRAVAAARAT